MAPDLQKEPTDNSSEPSPESIVKKPDVSAPPSGSTDSTPPSSIGSNQFGYSEEPKPNFATGQDVMPFQSATPGITSAKPSKKKKIIIIVIVVLLLALLAGAGAAYAIYNKPENVLTDAFRQAVASKTGEAKTNLEYTMKSDGAGPAGTFKATLVSKYSEQRQQHDLSLDIAQGPMSFKTSGAFLQVNANEFFFKIDNVKDLLSTVVSGNDEALAQFQPLITKLDGKWVKVTNQDLQQFGSDEKTNECTQKAVAGIRTDKNATNELTDLYKKHPFIKVDKRLASENVNGVQSLHYQLSFDEQKFNDFARDFRNTAVYKELVACDKDLEITDNELKEMQEKDPDPATVTAEVWIGEWNHQLTRVKLNVEDKNAKLVSTTEPTFDKAVDIKEPAANQVTPLSELQAELNNLMGGMLGGSQLPTGLEESDLPTDFPALEQ